MTLNERFVGGNPRILLLLFCLFCVVLICFVGICPTMMRKSKFFWSHWPKTKPTTSLEKKKKNFFSFKKKKKKPIFFQKVGTGRANPSAKIYLFFFPKKNSFFFLSSPFILQHKHLSSIKQPFKTSITIKPSYLPQIFTKSQNFFTQTIP